MRKEVTIAILVGFVFGLVITFGIWTANRTLKEKQATAEVSSTEISTPTPTAALTPTPAFFLEITSPENDSISKNAKITLSGKTQPGTIITIISDKGEQIIEPAADGSFTGSLSLVSGTNEITVTAFTQEGDEVSKNLNVVYSTAEI